MRLKLLYKTATGRRAKGLFLCDCGTIKELLLTNVRPGKTESCRCLHREIASRNGKATRKHGGTPSNLPRLFRLKADATIKTAETTLDMVVAG